MRCALRFTKCRACREICMASFGEVYKVLGLPRNLHSEVHAAAATKSTLRGLQSAVPATNRHRCLRSAAQGVLMLPLPRNPHINIYIARVSQQKRFQVRDAKVSANPRKQAACPKFMIHCACHEIRAPKTKSFAPQIYASKSDRSDRQEHQNMRILGYPCAILCAPRKVTTNFEHIIYTAPQPGAVDESTLLVPAP